MKKKSKKKILLELIIVILILATILSLTLKLGDYKTITNAFSNLNYKYLLISILISVISCFIGSYAGYYLLKKHKTPINNRFAFYLNNSEYFFNGITPFASGSQPFLAYYYLKYKVKPEDTTSSLMLNLIVYQFCALVISSFALIIYYPLLHLNLGSKIFIVWIGWIISALFTILMLLTVYVKSFSKLLIKIMSLLTKIKFLKKIMNRGISKIPKFINDYQLSAKKIITNPQIGFILILAKTSQIILFSSLIFFAIKTLNITSVSNHDFGYLFVISIISSTLMSWVPLPGTSGGTEGALIILLTTFTNIEVNTKYLAILLLWRFLSYYLLIFYGLFFTFFVVAYDQIQNKRLKKYLLNIEHKFKNNEALKILYLADYIDHDIQSDLSLFKSDQLNIDLLSKNNLNLKKKKQEIIKDLLDFNYDLIITDANNKFGSIAYKLASITKAPLIYLLRRKNISLHNFYLSKILRFQDLLIIRDKETLDKFNKVNSIKINNYLYMDEIKNDPNKEQLILDKTGINKMYENYQKSLFKNLLLINPSDQLISLLSSNYNLYTISKKRIINEEITTNIKLNKITSKKLTHLKNKYHINKILVNGDDYQLDGINEKIIILISNDDTNQIKNINNDNCQVITYDRFDQEELANLLNAALKDIKQN